MALSTELRNDRMQLADMIRELRTNQMTLNQLVDWYGVFLFTGGDVPRKQCDLVAITSYLERPFATDRISTGEVKRYGQLVETLMELGRALVPPGPKTLRCRKDMADGFDRVFSEIRTLGGMLESTLTTRLQEPEPSSPV
jgi:hypothetical protein